MGERRGASPGISLFIVPKWLPSPNGDPGERNDIIVMGLNHKMGYRGTTNCSLNFGAARRRPWDGWSVSRARPRRCLE